MAFPASESGRIGKQGYWTWFAAHFVAIVVLGMIAIGALAAGTWLLAILAFLLIAPVGLYFRVIMMRRCRDIGWPPFLPWLTFGMSFIANIFGFGSAGSGNVEAVAGSVVIYMLCGMADLVLMIVIGCRDGREPVDYGEVFGGSGPAKRAAPNQRAAPIPQSNVMAPRPSVATGDSDAMDDAIARALDNYRRTGSAVGGSASPGPAPAPVAATNSRPPLARAAGGFGRRVV